LKSHFFTWEGILSGTKSTVSKTVNQYTLETGKENGGDTGGGKKSTKLLKEVRSVRNREKFGLKIEPGEWGKVQQKKGEKDPQYIGGKKFPLYLGGNMYRSETALGSGEN